MLLSKEIYGIKDYRLPLEALVLKLGKLASRFLAFAIYKTTYFSIQSTILIFPIKLIHGIFQIIKVCVGIVFLHLTGFMPQYRGDICWCSSIFA
jgi:hypothetical protein